MGVAENDGKNTNLTDYMLQDVYSSVCLTSACNNTEDWASWVDGGWAQF